MASNVITEKIKISNTGAGMKDALNLTENIVKTLNLEGKNKFHAVLLAEEMFSMVRAITGNFDAEYWLEYKEESKCFFYNLEAKSTELNYEQRKNFISVSTQGKNIFQQGIMEKIREIFEAGLYNIEKSFAAQADLGVGLFSYDNIGINDMGMSEAVYSWSMQKYKSGVEINSDEWDELEKSIIANIADEVQVGVSNNSVKLIIQKKFD